ncbi:MAG: fluoride efflux transporter CrcB [Leptolyngbya sp. SIO4C5]|uniref:fluoride efflux transporter CrcB n=1 Tax=Sphaerothrix gracilis TaxID=3151835 RepID=UPI0013BFD6BC|nr:fluoride efflux transporter CrcB [Leptolyngbya sp. SIO4C5]
MLSDLTWRAPLAVSLGAIAGALSRYYLTLFVTARLGADFPYATLMINLTGCLGMGLAVTLIAERYPDLLPDLKLLVTTGFLGAYTTFSTYGLESIFLFKNSTTAIASLYWLGSAGLGLLCIQLGAAIAHWLNR